MKKRILVTTIVALGVVTLSLGSCGEEKGKEAKSNNVNTIENNDVPNDKEEEEKKDRDTKETESKKESNKGENKEAERNEEIKRESSNYGFDVKILDKLKEFATSLSDFGYNVMERAGDGVISKEDKTALTETINKIGDIITDIESYNNVTTDKKLKGITDEFINKMKEYNKLFIEGLDDQSKLAKANEYVNEIGKLANNVVMRALELME